MTTLTSARIVPYIAHRNTYEESIRAEGWEDVSVQVCESGNPWRMLCLTENFINEYDNKVPYLPVNETQSTAYDQIDDEFEQFCSGRHYLQPLEFHPIEPLSRRCWEFKTPDIRIFGWFVDRDFFVAHCLNSARITHGEGGYQIVTDHAHQVDVFRSDLKILHGSFIDGVRNQDVLSNKI